MTKSKISEVIKFASGAFEYHFVEFKEIEKEIKISKKTFRDTLSSQDLETVESRANAITASGGENRSKILCYLDTSKGLDQSKIKIKLSEYACHNVGISKKNFVSGVIVLCKTSDDKFIIGSRDASKAKDDPQNYPLQGPCGFMEEKYQIGDKSAFTKLKDQSLSFEQFVIENGIRELKEEILPFEDHEIIDKELIGGIFVVRQWPKKIHKTRDQPSTKDIANFKSFIVVVNVSLTFDEIQELRGTSRKPVDFDEITLIQGLTEEQINEQSLGKKPTEIELDFDGKKRKFVAEHCLLLPIIENSISRKISPSPQPECCHISSLKKYKEGAEL